MYIGVGFGDAARTVAAKLRRKRSMTYLFIAERFLFFDIM